MLADLRSAVRALAAARGLALVALAVLTLGIGATTAIFSVVDAVVLRGLPFDEGDRIAAVVLRSDDPARANAYHTAQDFVDWREKQDVYSTIAATTGGGLTIREGDRPEELRSQRVTAGFFDVLRVMPRLGRPFTPDRRAGPRAWTRSWRCASRRG